LILEIYFKDDIKNKYKTVKFKCDECGKIYEKPFKKDFFKCKNNFCCGHCQAKFLSNLRSDNSFIIIECGFCYKKVKKVKSRLKYSKRKILFCSRKCKDSYYKEIFTGEGHPNYNKKMSDEICKKHSESSLNMWKDPIKRQNILDALHLAIEKNGDTFGHDEKSMDKKRKTNNKLYNVDHAGWNVPEIRNKMLDTIKKRYGKTLYEITAGKRKKENTTIEIIFKDFLMFTNIKFEFQYKIYYNNDRNFKKYDFYLSDYNLLIEINGDYWHRNPKIFKSYDKIQQHNKENDIFKKNLAYKNNYKLFRLWETDIRNNNFINYFINYIIKLERKYNIFQELMEKK